MAEQTVQTTSGDAALPERPMLLPGVRAVRRNNQHLQVGLGRRRVLVDDTSEHRKLLRRLDGRERMPSEPRARALLATLRAAGLLVDGAAFWAAQAQSGAAATTAYAEDPRQAPARLARRAATRVRVVAPEPWAELADRLLKSAALLTAAEADEAQVALVVSTGLLPRAATDDLLRADVPHVSVQCHEGEVTLGPFVAPGRTACQRCVDAQLGESDPRRSLVIEQYADERTRRLVPDPIDAALMTIAVAWAARDIVTWVDGGEPSAWSSIVTLGARPEATPRLFARHPHCGCSWGDELAAG